MSPTTLVCAICSVEKSSSLFRPQRRVCKECAKRKRHTYREEHPDAGKNYAKAYALENASKIAANKKAWFVKNREQEILRMKAWREANAEHRKRYATDYDAKHAEENRARGKDYRKRNASHIRESCSAWLEKNPEKRREHRVRWGTVRRIREFGSTTTVDRTISLKLLLERDGPVCHICGSSIDILLPSRHRFSLVIDHLFPISFGGAHTWDNVGLAHFGCNSKVRHVLQIP